MKRTLLVLLLVTLQNIGFSQCNMVNWYFENPIVYYNADSVDIEFRTFDNVLLKEADIDFIDDCAAKENAIIFVVKDSLFGIFSASGKQITPIQYDYTPEIIFRKLAIYTIPNPFQIQRKGRLGLINHQGEEIIPCAYKSIEPFKGNYICKAEKIGVLDSLGNSVLPFEYDSLVYARLYQNDYAVSSFSAKKNQKWGAFDNENFKTIIPFVYDHPIEARRFNEGIINAKNGKFGLFLLDGTIKIDFKYEALYPCFSSGIYHKTRNKWRYAFKENGKYGLINQEGTVILKPTYDTILQIGENKSLYKAISDEVTTILNEDGIQLLAPTTGAVYARNDDWLSIERNDMWALYSIKQQKQVTEFKYEFIDDAFLNGLFYYENEGENPIRGIINSKGEVAIQLTEELEAEDFLVSNSRKETYYVQITHESHELKGLMDAEGKMVIPIDYEEIYDLENGLVGVLKYNRYGIIDPVSGKILEPVRLTYEAFDNYEGYAELVYQANFDNSTYQKDTAYFRNGNIKEIYTHRGGRLNGDVIQFDEFGQYIQTVAYQNNQPLNSRSKERATISFKKKNSGIETFIISNNESTLVTIPLDHEESFLIYDIRTGKYLTKVLPDDYSFYYADKYNSIIVGNKLYMALGSETVYKVLDLNTGHSTKVEFKEIIAKMSGSSNEKEISTEYVYAFEDEQEVIGSHTFHEGWITAIVRYDSPNKYNTTLMDLYAYNVITKAVVHFEDIITSKSSILSCLSDYDDLDDFDYLPKYNLLKLACDEHTYFFKVKGKKLKLVFTIPEEGFIEKGEEKVYFMTDCYVFDHYLLLKKSDDDFNTEYAIVTLSDMKETSVNMTYVEGEYSSLINAHHTSSLALQQTVFFNLGNNVFIFDEKNSKLSTRKYNPVFASYNHVDYLFGEEKLIGFTKDGTLIKMAIDDTLIDLNTDFQNQIHFNHYENNRLYLDSFELNLATGRFNNRNSVVLLQNRTGLIKLDQNMSNLLALSSFDTAFHKVNNDNKIISERVEKNGNEIISFYNGNEVEYLKRHVFLRVFNNSEFLLYTPDGYYMGSTGIGNSVYFEQNKVLYPFEQFDLKYNRPDLVLDRLGYADSSLIAAYHTVYKKRLKKMGFTEQMLQNDFNIPSLDIKNFEAMPTITDSASLQIDLNLHDNNYQLDRINVWLNDVAIYGSEGISVRHLQKKHLESTINVQLAKGTNKLQFSVLNQAGAESYKKTFYTECTAGKSKPDLYLISIGASHYQDNKFDLKYAAKDAQDVVNTFTKSEIYAHHFTKTLVDEQVTKNNVMALKEFLSEADINDVVMIFIAGHGVLDANLDYYLATYDMDFKNAADKGLAYSDLEGLLDGIAPLKKTLLIDACHSGEIDKSEISLTEYSNEEHGAIQFRAVNNLATPKLGIQNTSELMKSLFSDLRKGTGATVISAAGGLEFAMEGEDWKNGLFTYCLIDGVITSNADMNKDGEIWLSELQHYVSEQVAYLSSGHQQPVSRIENQTVDFRVW